METNPVVPQERKKTFPRVYSGSGTTYSTRGDEAFGWASVFAVLVSERRAEDAGIFASRLLRKAGSRCDSRRVWDARSHFVCSFVASVPREADLTEQEAKGARSRDARPQRFLRLGVRPVNPPFFFFRHPATSGSDPFARSGKLERLTVVLSWTIVRRFTKNFRIFVAARVEPVPKKAAVRYAPLSFEKV